MAFLSLLDDRAKPKGSRDPLGFELVWSHFGRKIIGNLTTITSSMDNFAVALLGFYWANDFVEEKLERSSRHKRIREIFLRYEQLTGYIRYYGGATDIMGITRIKQRIDDDTFIIALGLSTEQQILSDQASYGLLGLYSSAARETGLIEGNDRTLTSLGQSIAEAIFRQLGGIANELKSLLNHGDPLNRQELMLVSEPFMNAIQHSSVQEPLLEALLSGNPSEPRQLQKEVWQITHKNFSTQEERPENNKSFIDLVRANNPSERLDRYLQDILDVERLLVAINNIFHYCRRMDGESLAKILDTLRGRYNYSHLPETIPKDNFPRRNYLVSILTAFRNDEMQHAIEQIMQMHKKVMQLRSGAPWVEVEADNHVRVRIKSETIELRSQSEIERSWDYDYFLGSFLNIARNHIRMS